MLQSSGIRLFLVTLFLCACAGGLYGDAYTIPQSTRLVHGQVALPDGETLKFAVLEGQLLTLRNTEADYFFGFSPTINDAAHHDVSFAVFEITERGPDLQMLRQIESIDIAKSGWLAPVNAEIEITDIAESGMTAADLAEMQARMKVPMKLADTEQQPTDDCVHSGRCCVTCGTTSACGCAVTLSCGSCCQGPCCFAHDGEKLGEQ